MIRSHRLALATAGTLAAGLAGGQAAEAKVYRFGSTLKPRAETSKAHQADTVYWHTSVARGRRVKAPASGQVLSVRIKGKAMSTKKPGQIGGGGETLFHLQTLEPLSGGRMRVKVTSQDFYLPNRSARSQKITTYRPTNQCVAKGETVAFNHIGGWDGVPDRSGPYPNGTPLRIFSKVRGAGFRWFEGDNQTGNGGVFAGRRTGRRELLMQIRLGTGRDGTGLCPGGTKTSARTAGAVRLRRSGLLVPGA